MIERAAERDSLIYFLAKLKVRKYTMYEVVPLSLGIWKSGQDAGVYAIKEDPILRNLLVIRAPSNTNFKLTPQEWQRVHELKG